MSLAHPKHHSLALIHSQGFPGGTCGEEPTCQCRRQKRRGFDPWVGKIPWKRAWQPTPGFLPGESHGQRCLAGCSPWGREELDTTEVTENATHMSFVHMRVLGNRPGLNAVDSTNKQQLGVWGPLVLVPQRPCQGWLLRDPLGLSLILITSWSRDPSIPTF